MVQLLAGDIGGTKTILRLVDATPQDPPGKVALKTLHEDRYGSQSYPDLVPIVREFLTAAAAHLGHPPTPQTACFAIAGPVVDNRSSLTNLSWVLDSDRLEKELAIAHVALINDFAAVGYGVLGLDHVDVLTLQGGVPDPRAPIAVIGAGTGLGQGFLIPTDSGGYQVFPSEGGHADFAPRSELEFQLLKYLRDKHGITRVSVERVVSGQGIVSIYQFLRDRQIVGETPSIGDQIRAWERETGMSQKTIDPGAIIAQAAAAGDALSQQTMELFVSAYGAEAGNLALKLLPYGGLYIAGGIAAKNLPLMESGQFMQSFGDKGRISPLVEKVPVHLILNAQVGLIGAAIRAAQL